MSINELYNSPEYSDVLFYLSERGFSTIEDLASFDFEDLFFVPGLSEELIESAKAVFLSAKNSKFEPASKAEESEADSERFEIFSSIETTEDAVSICVSFSVFA